METGSCAVARDHGKAQNRGSAIAIKQVALDLNCKPHDLLIEGVNLILERHGRGTIEEIDARYSGLAQ